MAQVNRVNNYDIVDVSQVNSYVSEVMKEIIKRSGRRFTDFPIKSTDISDLIKTGSIISKNDVKILSGIFQFNTVSNSIGTDVITPTSKLSDYDDLLDIKVYNQCIAILKNLQSVSPTSPSPTSNGGCRGACLGYCNVSCVAENKANTPNSYST